MAEPLLALDGVSHRLRRPEGGAEREPRGAAEGSLSALIGPNGAGKTTLFALMSGFLEPDAGTRALRRPGHHRPRAAPQSRGLGMTRTFQIVQPFAAQTVRENIAVGVHLHERGRGAALGAGRARWRSASASARSSTSRPPT